MYVRKSSEDAEAQAKSLPDQIAACWEYARAKGLPVVDEPIQESKSAKKSGNRPLFSQMLRDLEKDVYDGILAWHTDRLSRNSLEAEMVVDMVDTDATKLLVYTNQTRTSHIFAKAGRCCSQERPETKLLIVGRRMTSIVWWNSRARTDIRVVWKLVCI